MRGSSNARVMVTATSPKESLLPLAKKMLFSVIDAIRDEVRAGVPVIVLEPSCAAVFRDEMQNMLPHDEDAKRLGAQVSLLGEFVQAHRERFDLPSLSGPVLFHGHCHQKSIFDVSGDKALLESMGAIVDAPDTGCCGMAGSFGFEAGHQEISRKIGERVLLPAVRAAAPETIVVADGFSCREQIAQMSRRRAVHLAQALRAAQTNAGGIDRPELTLTIDHAAETAARLPAYAAAALIGIGSILAIAGLRRER